MPAYYGLLRIRIPLPNAAPIAEREGVTMTALLWIFLGSGLGGTARYLAATAVAVRWGETFPWGILLVNVTGSFAIGFVAALVTVDERPLLGLDARHFVMTGVLGGYTTYSTFSLQTLALARAGEWFKATANAGGMFVLCFAAVALGFVCATWVNRLRGA